MVCKRCVPEELQQLACPKVVSRIRSVNHLVHESHGQNCGGEEYIACKRVLTKRLLTFIGGVSTMTREVS